MPNYDYRCTKCNHTFSKMKSMAQSADPETCPQCDGEAKRAYLRSPNMNMLFPGSSTWDDWKKKHPL